MIRIRSYGWLLLVVGMVVLQLEACQSRSERRRLKSEMERIKKDSVKPVPNPYKTGLGTQIYDAQRSALGNLDSAASPPPPAIPRH